MLTIYVAGMVGMVAASAIRGLAESADLQWAGTEASRGTDWAVAGTGVGLLLGLGFAIWCLRRPPRAVRFEAAAGSRQVVVARVTRPSAARARPPTKQIHEASTRRLRRIHWRARSRSPLALAERITDTVASTGSPVANRA